VSELFDHLGAAAAAEREFLSGPAAKLVSAVYSLLNTLNPEAVLVVTRDHALSAALSESLRSALASTPPFASQAVRDIVPHQYDPVIAGQGAGDLVFDSFFATVGG
jgi:hypothetical protein